MAAANGHAHRRLAVHKSGYGGQRPRAAPGDSPVAGPVANGHASLPGDSPVAGPVANGHAHLSLGQSRSAAQEQGPANVRTL